MKTYSTPVILQVVFVDLEEDLLFGSIVDFIHPVETFGAEVDQRFDYSFTSDNTFNHKWEE